MFNKIILLLVFIFVFGCNETEVLPYNIDYEVACETGIIKNVQYASINRSGTYIKTKENTMTYSPSVKCVVIRTRKYTK